MDILNIVVPCYNEQECLRDSAGQLCELLQDLISRGKVSDKSRIVFVNDGSKDATWQIIEQLHSENTLFEGVKLSRNRGHQTAVVAGIEYSSERADMVISIDADLQDDICVIETMIDKYYDGNDIIYGVRESRDTDTAFKRGTAGIYYKLLSAMGVEIINQHADFRLMSRRACKALLEYRETNLFLRGIVPQIGFNSCTVGYKRKLRTAGVSKYPLKKMLALAFDGITSFSVKPLKLITFFGATVSIISALITAVFSLLFLCGMPGMSYQFYILTSIWLVGGLNSMMLGIIGSYIGRIYQEVKNRPRYFIDKVLSHGTDTTDLH